MRIPHSYSTQAWLLTPAAAKRLGLLVSLASSYRLRLFIDSCAVVAADGLSKREVFRLPDPFAVITVDAEQTHTTSAIKKTLNPYWNESFDM